MPEPLKLLVTKAASLLATRWGRNIRLTLAVLVGAAAFYGVGRQMWQGANAMDWANATVDWAMLTMALGLALVSQFLGGLVWQMVLRGFGHSVSLLDCATIHSSSNLAKYIPGYAWQILGKAYLTRQHLVPAPTISLALATEFAGLICTALLTAALLLDPQRSMIPLALPPWLRLAAMLAMTGLLIAAPWFLGWVRNARRGSRPAQVSAGWLWSAFMVMLAAWLILGTSTSLIVQAISKPVAGLWPASTATLALSFMFSFAVFFVPAGIGVREGALTWLLGPLVGGGVAALTAIISRLSLTLAELLASGLLWGIKSVLTSNNRSITQSSEAKMSPPSPSDGDQTSQ